MTKREKHIRNFAAVIINQLKLISAPWQKPWKAGLPRNFVSNKPYRGYNAVWLMSRATEQVYNDPRWGTYLQINRAGGTVKKGERGVPILFIKSHLVADPMAELVPEEFDVPKYRREIQYWAEYRVFNVEQTDGLDLPTITRSEWRSHNQAENVIQSTGVTVVHSATHTEATYFPGRDVIHMPPPKIFPTAEAYYRTVLHELAHATGHPSRMKRECMRDGTKRNLSIDDIAREELRAEICSMIVNATLGIQHDPTHGTAYIKEWISVFEDDPTELYRATAEAQKMSDYLLSSSVEHRKTATSQQSDTSIVDS